MNTEPHCPGDCDEDGRLDVFIALAEAGSVQWLRNGAPVTPGDANPDFSSGPALVIDGLPGARGLALADVNADGRMDVLVAGFDADRVVWVPGGGSGVFGAGVPVGDGGNGASVALPMDVDGDGDQDVVVLYANAGTVVWYESGVAGSAASPAVTLPDGDVLGTGRVVARGLWNAHTLFLVDMDSDQGVYAPRPAPPPPHTHDLVERTRVLHLRGRLWGRLLLFFI